MIVRRLVLLPSTGGFVGTGVGILVVVGINARETDKQTEIQTDRDTHRP